MMTLSMIKQSPLYFSGWMLNTTVIKEMCIRC